MTEEWRGEAALPSRPFPLNAIVRYSFLLRKETIEECQCAAVGCSAHE